MPSQPAMFSDGVVRLLGDQHHRVLAHAPLQRAGQRLLQAHLHAVEQRAGAAEGEHAAGAAGS